MNLAVFYFTAFVAVLTAAVVVLHRNPVVEALSLALHLCTIAFFFVLLSAPFAAVIQIILYAGAIMVLFLFVVMLLDPGGEGKAGRVGRIQLYATILGAAALLAAISPVFLGLGTSAGAATVAAGFGGVEAFGRLLFTDYLFPFEAASILLLAAMIGALYLAKREID
jgi:NADH-quinone oxidoreductase subunit J